MLDHPNRLHEVAVSLMRLALPLLDRAGDTLAAARLQHAIDTALDTPPMPSGDEPEPITLVATTAPAGPALRVPKRTAHGTHA